MNERYKIGEAKFFLARMEESLGDRTAFRYRLSAFLTAAQSVLQYAQTESEAKGNPQWYVDNVTQTNVARNNLLKDFKEKRDANVHRGEPVDPSSHMTIPTSEAVSVFDAVSVMLFNDKAAEMREPKEEPPPPKSPEGRSEAPESRTKATVQFYFVDWSSPEDLISLSHRYIEELEKFVQKGMEEGILSG